MVKCPACRKEVGEAKKAWKYGRFQVQAYACECGTDFREYTYKERHSFMLKKGKKDKKWVKP